MATTNVKFGSLNVTFDILLITNENLNSSQIKIHSYSIQYTQVFCCFSLTWSGVTSGSWWLMLAVV